MATAITFDTRALLKELPQPAAIKAATDAVRDREFVKDDAMAEAANAVADHLLAPRLANMLRELMLQPFAAFDTFGMEVTVDVDDKIEELLDDDVRRIIGLDAIGSAINTLDNETANDRPAGSRVAWVDRCVNEWSPALASKLVEELGAAKALSAAGVTWTNIKDVIKKPARGAAKKQTPESEASAMSAAEASAKIDMALSALRGTASMLGATGPGETTKALGGQHVINGLVDTDDLTRQSMWTAMGLTAHGEALGEVLAAGHPLPDANALLAKIWEERETLAPEKPAAAAAPEAPPKKEKKRDAQKTGANRVVAALREHTSLKDAELAARLGISRTAMVNIAIEKTGWDASDPAEYRPLVELVEQFESEVASMRAELEELGAVPRAAG